jgi:AcrR family transcriptional regulator
MRSQKSCNKMKTAFLSLLSTQGASVRITSILEIAEISKSTFYTYYENIDQLAIDIINDYLRELDTTLENHYKKAGERPDDFISISQWVIKHQSILLKFSHSKYRKHLRESVRSYIASRIVYQQKLLSGNLDYDKAQGDFLAHGYIGSVFEGLTQQNDEKILQSGVLLSEMVALTANKEVSNHNKFFLFHNTSHQCSP